MNNFSFLLCSSALTALLVGPAAEAVADTITQTEKMSAAKSTPYSGQALTFTGYHGAQPLLSVTVKLIDHVTGTVKGVNTKTVSLTFSSAVKNTLTLTEQPSNLSLPKVIDVSNGSGQQTVPPESTYTTPILTGSAHKTSAATGSFSDFETTWKLTFSETGKYEGSAESGIDLSAKTQGLVSASVIYTYQSTSVPEPASVALLGVGLSGLAGVGVIRRRRSKT